MCCGIINVRHFGARGDGVTDDTIAIQAAITAAAANPLACKGVLFPDGNYKLSSSVGLNLSDIVGLRLYGNSRGGTIFTMAANNTPIFHFTANLMQSCVFEKFTVAYSTMQTGNTSAVVFQLDGPAGASVYNNVWQDIWASNFYYFANAPVSHWWGNTYRDMVFGDFAGGINTITSGAGEPNCRFERLYINCPSATQTLFTHNAVTAQYDNVEVNQVGNGVAMLEDFGGGLHIIGHWALEVATCGSNVTLFNVPNGQLVADVIYTEAITINSGATVTAFACNGTSSSLDVRLYLFNSITVNSGNFVVANLAGPLTSHFGDIRIPFSGTVSLTDVGASLSCQYLAVDWWNDRSRMQMNIDANVTIAFNDPYHQVFDAPLTANRTVTLPEHRPLLTNNLFAGRAFRFTKTNTSAFSLTIKDSQGVTVAIIPASTKGVVEVAYNRASAAGSYWVVM